MLVKAVALSLVLGGVGFVANNAQAADISDGVKVYSGMNLGLGHDVKTETALEKDTALANQKDLVAVNKDVETNKANIATNAGNISDNRIAIEKEAGDRQADISMVKDDIAANADAIKTKADAWETTKSFAKVQEQLDTQDNKNKAQDVSIKAHAAAIKANKEAINTKADAWETTKNFANVQEQLDTQDNKNKAQDVSIKAHTAAIKANKEAIKANKDAIENEATTRENADKKLQNNINAEATTRENAVNALNSRIDQVGSDATKGIAKASALAALHPLDYDPDNKFDIAAAGGFYKGENAFALGAFYRPNRNVMLSMGTTLTSGDNAYNVGLTFKIGKSGKHTEAGLTTADLYAMIGAMQDKMDQQQKKIEELEAKQAK